MAWKRCDASDDNVLAECAFASEKVAALLLRRRRRRRRQAEVHAQPMFGTKRNISKRRVRGTIGTENSLNTHYLVERALNCCQKRNMFLLPLAVIILITVPGTEIDRENKKCCLAPCHIQWYVLEWPVLRCVRVPSAANGISVPPAGPHPQRRPQGPRWGITRHTSRFLIIHTATAAVHSCRRCRSVSATGAARRSRTRSPLLRDAGMSQHCRVGELQAIVGSQRFAS